MNKKFAIKSTVKLIGFVAPLCRNRALKNTSKCLEKTLKWHFTYYIILIFSGILKNTKWLIFCEMLWSGTFSQWSKSFYYLFYIYKKKHNWEETHTGLILGPHKHFCRKNAFYNRKFRRFKKQVGQDNTHGIANSLDARFHENYIVKIAPLWEVYCI